jgi:hypothetical protein
MTRAAVYKLKSRAAVESNYDIRLNFDEPIADEEFLVASGTAWTFRAPLDGVYFLQASVFVEPAVDVALKAFAKTQDKNPRILVRSPYVPSVHSEDQLHTIAFLKRGDEVWFAASHSKGNSPMAYAVGGTAAVALLFPSA